MKSHSTSTIQKVVFLSVCLAFFNIFVPAQDLKSKSQGDGLLKLNGAFEIPAKEDPNFAGSAPLSAVVGDLDADGVDDLIVGHADSVSIQRGDINAFAPQTQKAWEAIRDLQFISPFESEKRIFPLPLAAEFLQIGDFTRDGKMDVAAASRNSNVIVLLEGDGKGNFIATREIYLGGNPTAMAIGDVNRPDGFADLIAAVGKEILIFQGLGDLSGLAPRRVTLAHDVEAIVAGQLDANDFTDLAVGGGNQISIVSGGDDENEVSVWGQDFSVKSLVLGDFVPDRGLRQEIAALDAEGTIHVLTRGDLDTRPISPIEQLALQVREMQAKNMPVSPRILKKLGAADLRESLSVIETANSNWAEYDRFFVAAPDGLASANAVLTSGRLSEHGEDLIVLDSSNNEIVVMPLGATPDTNEIISYAGRREAVRFRLDGAPLAAIATRLNFDGNKDLLILQNGQTQSAALVTAPEAVFAVNNNGDQPDANPGNGVCATAGGFCTLRAAIMEANVLAGDDSITINAGINITLSTGNPDNDALGTNSAAEGDLDIFCAISSDESTCNLSSSNDLTITGAAGGNSISAGTFTSDSGLSTTDRVFDIGMDGVFGGGFGGSVALDVTMSNLTIQNGNVREDFNSGIGSGNYARGGAIRMDGFGQAGTRGSLTLTNVTINNNQADHDTGGVFNQYASVAFSSVTATNNIGKAGPGGALQFLAGVPATLSVSNSSFTGNQARTGNVFTTPATDTDGGAIAASNNTNTATITGTNFTNNISYDDGGALKAFNGAFTVTGGVMSGNTARDDGGAVWGDIDTVGAARFLTLSGVTLQNNTANSDNSGGGDGGAIFRDRGTLNVINSTIGGTLPGQPNSAVNGGAIAHAFRAGEANPSNVTTINLDNGSINGNNATTSGGAVNFNGTFAQSPSVLNVGATTSIAVNENNANVHGGAFALTGGAAVNLTRAAIHGNDADKDNNASGDGGAVYHSNSGGTLTVASNVSLGQGGQGNTAENGGAIHHSLGTLTLNSPTISSNAVDTEAEGLFVSGGTVNVNNVAFPSNSSSLRTQVRLTGGTTNFTGAITIPGELSIAGGTLAAGSSTINLGEDFHFSSGTFNAGTSIFNFNGTGAQQIYGNAAPTFNNVTIANTAQPFAVNNNANANGNFTVNANAVLNPAAAAVIGGTGTLTGNGTVRVSSSSGFSAQYTITNKTLTNLLVDYVGLSTQTVSATTYGNLRLNNTNGGNLAGATIVNGALTLQEGVLGVGTSTLTLNGTVSQTNGTISSSATGTVNYNQSSNGQSVMRGTYGNLTFSNFNKTLPSSGMVIIAGIFTPGSATGHTVTGSNVIFGGSGAQAIPSFTYNNLSTSSGGVKTVGTTVNVGGNATVGAGTTLLVPAASTLTVAGTLTNNGTIQGTGTIINNFTNTGTLSPGLSPGILSVTGNFANSGTLNVEIGGTAGAGVNPNGHDQVLVSGAATVGGTLNVTLTNGFTPTAGNSFVILDAASSSGNFSTTNLPSILPNVWSVQYNDAAGTITLAVMPPTAASALIAGRVLSPEGRAIPRARISFTNSSGATRTVQANSFGRYQIEGLSVGENYVVSVSVKGYRFASRVVSLSEDITDLDFVADSAP